MLRSACLLILFFWSAAITTSFAQGDTTGTANPEMIRNASIQTKKVLIDLSNPAEVEMTLKKIHTFKYIEEVTLQGGTDENTLKKIVFRLSVLKNLTLLKLEENELTRIPDNITLLKNLQTLSIEGNQEMDYNDLFEKVKALSINELDLSDNDLKKMPSSISKISSLKKIQLSGNEQLDYKDMVVQLSSLSLLTTLSVPFNYLSDLPDNISRLKNLRVLDVSNNILSQLPNDISGLKAINNLSIQGNLLLNPVKDLQKLQGNDIQFLSLDKELTGEEIEQIKKIFPRAEISFPLSDTDMEVMEKISDKQLQEPETKRNGELTAKKDISILSMAYLTYPAIFRGLQYNFDTLNFEERYSSFRYTNGSPLPNNRAWLPDVFIYKNLKYRAKGKETENWFLLPETFIRYPELKAFFGMYWVYDGPLTKKEFENKFIKKTTRKKRGLFKKKIHEQVAWLDLRILYNKNSNLFTIELKGDSTFEKFTAYPLMPNIPLDKNQKTYSRRFYQYQKALARRSASFKKDQLSARRLYDRNFNSLKTYAWKELQLRMNEDEKLMSKDEWLLYYDQIIANEVQAINNSSLTDAFFERALLLRNYTVNTQRLSVSATIGTIDIDFQNATGAGKLPVARIWVLDHLRKNVTQYNGNLGTSSDRLPVKQFASQSIVVQMRNGDFGVVNSEEIDKQKIAPGVPCRLRVQVLDRNLNTTESLIKLAQVHN